MSHTIYAAKFEQTITFTIVLTVTIELCLHVLIARCIFINYGVNIEV